MTLILVGCYLCLHALAFVLFFRHRPAFRTEGGVFLLHAISAVALFIFMLAWFGLAPSGERFAIVIAACAAHGIYSLSFLEIWALSEGGYSLRVLHEVVQRQQSTLPELEAHFSVLSSDKKEGRLDSLLKLHLLKKDGSNYSLTTSGKTVAKFIETIGHLAQLEKTG